jgi:hypothetical protein
MIILTLLSALLLSGIAAYYSIIGLAAIFTGAFWPIVFMGSVLEMSKLVTASWLYRNWKTCPLLLKSYLTSAVVILMVITSMGIFGFLSKAHIDSTLEAGANSVEIRTLKQQEKIANERLEYLLKRAGNPETASASVDRQIQQTQKELADINKRKLPLLKEENKLVAEVGPIKYIGDMVYGVDDANAIDKAVRLVIMLIMVVFDPLAVLLLIAANMSMQQRSGKPVVENDTVVALTPETESFKLHKKFWKKKEEKANTEIDIPVFVETKPNVVEVEKENITSIEEVKQEEKEIVIDSATGETMPPIAPRQEHHAPGIYSEHHEPEPVKKLEPKYDYDAEFAFREKGK